VEINMGKSSKKVLFNIDYNKSSGSCPPCKSECKKINKKIKGRKLSSIKNKEVPHLLKVFNI
tara:strand:- start:5508 stop:5693 length:186 start_codon:yes stop_codon:yes gene_type:complete